MNECYFNTPYSLNMKLNRLKPRYLRNKDVNKICNNLYTTIPILNNQFSYLKNRSKSLNKYLNESNIAYNDTSFLNKKYYPTTNIYQNFLYNNDDIPFNNNISVYSNNKNNLYPEQTIFNNYSYKNNNNYHRLKNSKSTPFFNENSYNNSFTFNNKDSLNNNYIESNNLKNNFEYYNSFNNNIKNNKDNNYYPEKTPNLNNCIQQKDEIINELQVLVKKTMNKLNKKQEENNLLQNEISELKKNNSVCYSPYHFNYSNCTCNCNCSCNCSYNCSCYHQPLCSDLKKDCGYCKYLEEENKPSNFTYERKNKFDDGNLNYNLNEIKKINYKVNNLINENNRNNHRFKSQIYNKKKLI